MSTDRRSLLKSASLVSALTLVSRLLGFVRDAMMSHFLGASAVNAAFQLAFQVPHFLRRVLGEGSLSAFIVPLLHSARNESGPAAEWRLLNNALNALGVVTIAISGLFVIFPQPFYLLYGGSKHYYEARAIWELGCDLTAIMFPFVAIMTVASLLMGALHARNRFFEPAIGSSAQNLAMLAVGAWWALRGWSVEGDGAREFALALAWAVLVGGALRALIMAPPLLAAGWRWSPIAEPRDARLRELLGKMSPAFAGLGIYQFNLMAQMTIAAWISDASVPYLTYGMRLMQLPLSLIAVALSTAILPRLSQATVDGDSEGLRGQMSFAVRALLIGFLPATVGLIVLGRPTVQFLFESGQWTRADTFGAHYALAMYALGLIPMGLQHLLTQYYYSQKDMATPVRIGAIGVGVNVSLCLALMGTPFEYGGLALAGGVASAVNVWLLWRGRRAQLGLFWDSGAVRVFRTAGIAALLMGGLCEGGYGWTEQALMLDSRVAVGLATLIWVGVGAGFYYIVCRALGLREIQALTRRGR